MDFNEIKNTWKNSLKDKHLNASQIEVRLAIKKSSNLTLDKIKRNYRISLVVIVITYLVFLTGAIIYLRTPIGFAIIVTVTILISWAFQIGLRNYKKIKNTVMSDDTIRPALMKTISIMEKSLRFGMGNLYKYVLIPVALIAGIAIGIYIGASDKGYMETIYTLQTRSIIKIVLVVVIGSGITIPYSQFLMKRMYKNHLDELKVSLKELDEIE